MAIILKANKVNLFVSSILFVFWYRSPNLLDTPRLSPNGMAVTITDEVQAKQSFNR
jgi:hypothetical protein